MAFFFNKRPSTVAHDLQLASGKDAVRKGTDSFEVEMLSHLGTLYGVACRMTRSMTEAEDLVQDTVVKAMRSRDLFESGTNLKAWLLRILTNTFINRYHRGGLEREVIDGPDAESLTEAWIGASTLRAMRDPERQALLPLLEGEVQRALDELPDEFRIPVVLSDIEELSYKEIAEAMGCPIGTVMSRLYRGRRLLQKSLREHAVAMGIVPEVAAEPKHDDAPADLNAYRQRKRGAA